MSGDSRKEYLIATISNHFGYSVSDGAVAHIPDSTELNNFLDDGNCLLLAARLELTEGVKLVQVCVEIISIALIWSLYLLVQAIF